MKENKQNLKVAPKGDVYLPYTQYDYLTNGELIDINVNNIQYLYKNGGSGEGKITLGQYLDEDPKNLTITDGVVGSYVPTSFEELIEANEEFVLSIAPNSLQILKRSFATVKIETLITNITTDNEFGNIQLQFETSNSEQNTLIQTAEEGTYINSILLTNLEIGDIISVNGIRLTSYNNTASCIVNSIKITIDFVEKIQQEVSECTAADGSNCYSKSDTDALLSSKASQNDLNELDLKVEDNTTAIQDLNTNKADNTTTDILATQITTNANNISILENTTEQLATEIEDNTTSINTLNGLIQESFETFGSYTSPAGSGVNETIKPTLTENLPLDSNYVEVSVSPEQNLFINKKDGKIIFTIGLSNLTNEGADVANLGLNIWYNGALLITPNIDIPIGWSGSRTITGGLEVAENSQVYVEYVITGSLSVDAPIQYNIDYNSQTFVANPSSAIINDKTENPNLGINADLNLIYTLQNQLNSLQTQVNNLMLPIGSIVFSPTIPQYGTWTLLGTLAEGQTIIGGANSNGAIKSHRHRWFFSNGSYGMESNNGGNRESIKSITTFDQSGSQMRIGDNSESVFLNDGYTEQIGSDKNYPYGLGVGTMNVYRRES